MISQRLTAALIVLMAIMPVAVAFGHYSAIVSQLSVVQFVKAIDDMHDAGASNSAHADHCQPDKAHLASCSFHVCVDCAITSSFGFFAILDTSRYSAGEIPTSASLLVPPDIKPPIIAL